MPASALTRSTVTAACAEHRCTRAGSRTVGRPPTTGYCGGWHMDRKNLTERETKDQFDRGRRTLDRRGFLAGAGRVGALLAGAGAVGVSSRSGAAQTFGDSETFPVAEKEMIRVYGLVQRRSGLTKRE